jgi:cytochrome c6
MKDFIKLFVLGVAIVCFITFLSAGQSEAAKSGEALFKEHCAMCHVDGGNIVNPKKTLHKKDLETNNIKTAEDIIKAMRNPGPGMTKFDERTIPPKEAKEIAEYIIKKFK